MASCIRTCLLYAGLTGPDVPGREHLAPRDYPCAVMISCYYILCSIFSTEAGQNVSYDYPSHIQCYWQLPHCIKPIFEMGIFVTLGLSGTYYIYIYIYVCYAQTTDSHHPWMVSRKAWSIDIMCVRSSPTGIKPSHEQHQQFHWDKRAMWCFC